MTRVEEPTYDHGEGVDRVTFPDETQVAAHHAALDRTGHLWANVVATGPQGQLCNRARIDLRDLRDRERFHIHAASISNIDWPSRLLVLLDRVEARFAAETRLEDKEVIAELGMSPWHESAEPFPVEVLPTPLATFVREASATLPCAPDLVGVPLLAVLGAAIGTRCVLEVRPHWQEGARLYAAVVARPGEKKSPALDRAAAPYYAAQRRLHSDFVEAKEAHTTAMRNHEVMQAKWNQDFRKGKADYTTMPTAPPAPQLAQILTTDATLEAIAVLLEQNPGGLLFLRNELTAWVLAMNQNKGGRGTDRQSWLSVWSGAPVMVNRKSRQDPIMLHHPFLCVTGCIPPDMLGDLTDERGRDDGFIHRILICLSRPCAHWMAGG